VLLATAGCLAGAIAVPGTAAAASPADAEKSIVLLSQSWEGYVQYPVNGVATWSKKITATTGCTGWFASDQGDIVAAGHCVEPAQAKDSLLQRFLSDNNALNLLPQARTSWRVEGRESGSPPTLASVRASQPKGVPGTVLPDAVTLQVVNFQPFENGDLAHLKINGLTERTPPLAIASKPPQIGDQVTAIGFPGSVANSQDALRLRASFKSGTVSSTQVSPKGVPRTEVNADISPGMSGGPTINGQGEVLGVNSFILNGETRNFNFITDQASLRTFLQREGIQIVAAAAATQSSGGTTATAGLPRPESSGSGFPLWAGLLIGLLVLVTAGMGLLLWRRRAVAQPAGGPDQGHSAPDRPYEPFAGTEQHYAASGATSHSGSPHEPQNPGPQNGGPTEGCSHTGNSPGAAFCQHCGAALAR
jgi:hypothetical protein